MARSPLQEAPDDRGTSSFTTEFLWGQRRGRRSSVRGTEVPAARTVARSRPSRQLPGNSVEISVDDDISLGRCQLIGGPSRGSGREPDQTSIDEPVYRG
jgi:hypothetical protein